MSAKSRRSVGEVSVNEKVHRPRYIWNVYRSTIDRYIDRQIGRHYLVSSDYRPLYRPSVDRLSTAIYPLTSPRCWSRWSGWNTVIYVKHHGIGEITLYFSFCSLFESFYSFILVASFLVDFYFSYVGWRTAWYRVSGGVQPIKSFMLCTPRVPQICLGTIWPAQTRNASIASASVLCVTCSCEKQCKRNVVICTADHALILCSLIRKFLCQLTLFVFCFLFFFSIMLHQLHNLWIVYCQ